MIAAVVGRENTLGCAVSWGATFVQPGYVLMTSSPDAMSFALGSPYGENEKIPLAARLLKCAGRVYTEKNFIGARWSKLIVNSAFSSLSAITSFTFGRIAAGRDTRPAAQRLLKEGIDTALACGVTPAKIQGHDLVKWLNYSGAVKRALSYALIPVAMKKHKNLVSGMYFDLAAGKKSEMLRLLESYRKELLDRLHADRQKIDCLDFFIFQMKKEKGECVRPEHPR